MTKQRTGCDIGGCTGKHFGLGYCTLHYRRLKRHGDPLVKTLRVKMPYAARRRNDSLKARYGITAKDYDAMFAAQGGVCGICGSDNPGSRHNRFHVDHDHKTGQVRGLLCAKCNHGLGFFADSLGRLENAAAWLQ